MSFHWDTLYGAYISQLIRYSRACGSYHDFLDRVLLKTRKLLNHGSLLVKFKPSVRLGYTLRIIYVTNDNGYAAFVVITIRFFPHSGLINDGIKGQILIIFWQCIKIVLHNRYIYSTYISHILVVILNK